jgi:hypothetical protein
MPNYQNGKIYKITSGDLTYIGSTCEPNLARRLSGHVRSFRQFQNGKGSNVSSYQLIETGQYEITLIELCPCGSKDELTARERFHIENTVCVNKIKRPIITNEERQERINSYAKSYREDPEHKELFKDYHKTYRQDHAEELKAKKKEYYNRTKNMILR